ncbi:MAG: hypothetical protein PHH54_06055 [Candidatus Nanoarchaeia archaeon]|nr:hypothetical protein [Candidatus Nanoarchaeia archaeon]MDD5741518.1 hypothetical protein [Candidatus Nanoarchaeia archaeon]
MTEINIKEAIPDKNSFFNVKRFKIGNLNQDFLIKTMDIPNTSKKLWQSNQGMKENRLIFEKTKTIKSFEDLKGLLNESNDKKINNFFDKKTWLNHSFTLFHATLKFNPYNHVKKLSEIEGFWHYYYTFSKDALLIPNIVKDKTPYEEDKPQKKEEIVSFSEYMRFVDELYQLFQQMNNKPIFVPISLKFSITEIKQLIEHYLSKEYFYYWIDFESRPADPSNSAIYAKIRQINILLRNSKQFDKCVMFVTNLRREIISNIKDENSPASDILGTLCGANIIGVNRDPAKYFPEMRDKPIKAIQHKARLFDPESYYYKMLKNNNPNKAVNITENSTRVGNEFDKQKEAFLEDLNIQTYLKKKEMINQYNNGKILKSIQLKEEVNKKLF